MKIDKIKKLKSNKVDDIKLKTLIPTLRQKKRFLKIKITTNQIKDFDFFVKIISKSLIEYIGMIDFGKNNIYFLKEKYDNKKNIFILRCSTKILNKIVATLNLVRFENFEIKIEKISSTLKGLEKSRK